MGVALASGPLAALPASAAPEDVVAINLLNINDFHGRIDTNTVQLAGTIERLRAEAGEANTLFLSAGDNIGASLFASSSQNDEPTLDVLNALDLAASAVGNHEFDQGFDDLTGRVTESANWPYLGANVYLAGTTDPALDEYAIFQVDDARVAVVGAVTELTPSLVSPDGIAGLEFGDPVEAVNRVVAELVAGDLADVIVAEYHEGVAPTEGGAAPTAPDSLDIVTETSADVDAIFTGHTHAQYVRNAQIPGAAAGETRPILQTGEYGANVGQIVLNYDTATDEVVDYVAQNVARPTLEDDVLAEADAALVAQYPRVAEVKTLVDAALAEAAVLGNVPVGEVTADITRAYAGDSEDRGAESSLGNLVANALLSSLADPAVGGAEIGVVNPGGLRADLTYASSPGGEGDGVLTYAEANAVLPFVNNLWTKTLTGAQFKTVLEQQWQTDAAGVPPSSRPILRLGLSNNVSYTYDDTRAQGDRITSITVDGTPIDLERGYRIGSFNFLLQGGDNFREFTNGTELRDSGLVDRDAWVDYLAANSPIAPAFDRRSVSVTGLPAEPLAPGATASVTVSPLDLASRGGTASTEVSAAFEGSAAVPVVSPVVAGSAAVAFTVPDDVLGAATLVITANESGTVVRVPLTISESAPTPPAPGPGAGPGAPPVPGQEPAPGGTPALSPIPAAAALIPGLEGDISMDDPTAVPGQILTITVGTQYSRTLVSAILYSAPTRLSGSLLVTAAGQISVTIPAGTPAGAHRIAVQDAAGNIIGWTRITVLGGGTARSLALSGTDVAPIFGAGALLVLAGGVMVLVRRRSHTVTKRF
jgi:5'-nucleotidase